jgi:hypothetical protein
MGMVTVPNCGKSGVLKDLSVHEIPLGAWSDALNIRFLDGYAYQFYGHSEIYATVPVVPQFVMPVAVAGAPYWVIAGASSCYVVNNNAGTVTYTDVTHATPRAGVVNQWTGVVFGGIPILNVGDTTRIPMYWDQNLANNFVDLTAWPANTYCRSLRSYKNFLIALGITKAGASYPYMVKWSSAAVAGALPSTWDETDATEDAGETDLAQGQDKIIDGFPLRDSFMIYKERSIWRMDFIGGIYVFSFRQVLGNSGAMNRNCIVEIDGYHCVLTGDDVIIHDGQNATSMLDKVSRRYLFANIDVDARGKCFVFKNPYLNEVFICYPSIGATACDRAMVWNSKDRTVSFRELPSLNHADSGPVGNTVGATYDQQTSPFDSYLTLFNGPDYTPDQASVVMASGAQKLYLLDGSSSFDGVMPSAYLERQGLSFDAPESMKLVKGIRPRITGNVGETVTVKIAGMADAYDTPVYTAAGTMTYTIGQTVACDCFISGRYMAIRFESGTAFQWRLDSYTLDINESGAW